MNYELQITNYEERNASSDGGHRNSVQSEAKTPKSKKQSGFTLLELMISMFIIIILLSVALPAYQRTVQHARETVLAENLFQMRRAIDQYAADKGKYPQSVDDLVKEEYLREKPVDPITEKSEWSEITGEADSSSSDDSAEQQGLKDVKSLAEGEDSDGKKYQDY
jgi:prepilin-type N-terminal cleavage/methylation domain-containing protein